MPTAKESEENRRAVEEAKKGKAPKPEAKDADVKEPDKEWLTSDPED